MEKSLWYLLAGTRAGGQRARIIRELDEQPKNANELATELDVGYNTVRHHLDMLVEHGIVEAGEKSYGKPYFLSDEFETHRGTFETITDKLE